MIPSANAQENGQDSRGLRLYGRFMEEQRPYITIKLCLSEPVEVEDFARFFAAVSTQFQKYIKDELKDNSAETRIFIKSIREGSIIADLFPDGWSSALAYMDNALIVVGFASLWSKRVRNWIAGRDDAVQSKSDLTEVLDTVEAIAKDPDGRAIVETAVYEQGVFRRRVALTFSSAEAREAVKHIDQQRLLLSQTSGADYERVLMYFKRSDVGSADVGKRSGERVIIPAISQKDRALMYASKLAEERIKDEIRHSDDNIYKKGFVVDVNVQHKQGRWTIYAVTNVHQIIDLDEG